MESVFDINDYNNEGEYIKLIGRTLKDFHKNDNIYIKGNNEYKKVGIDKIVMYRVEVEELNSALTAAIYLKYDYEQFGECDMFLYKKVDA